MLAIGLTLNKPKSRDEECSSPHSSLLLPSPPGGSILLRKCARLSSVARASARSLASHSGDASRPALSSKSSTSTIAMADSALSSGSDTEPDTNDPLKRAGSNGDRPRIRFAPLPDPRRHRAYSTGRNVWLGPDETGEQHVEIRVQGEDEVKSAPNGGVALERTASLPANESALSTSAPPTTMSPLAAQLGRSSSLTRRLLAPLGLSRTSTFSSEESTKSTSSWSSLFSSSSSTATDVDAEPMRTCVYPPVAQRLELEPGQTMSPPMYLNDMLGPPPPISPLDMETTAEDEEGSDMWWLRKRRAEREARAMALQGDVINEEMAEDKEDEEEEAQQEQPADDDDLSPEELAREDALAEEAQIAEVQRNSLGNEKVWGEDHLPHMRKTSSGTTPPLASALSTLALSSLSLSSVVPRS